MVETSAHPGNYPKKNGLKRIILQPYFPILVLIVMNISIGFFTVRDYGESWDEANNKIYAEQSLEAYSWWGNKDIELDDYLGPTNQRFRGPAYPMIASLFVSLMQEVNNNWSSIDLWHFASFLGFQLGVFFFYMICIRFMKVWAGLGATLLFVTQPLLWGHAFINSKDIPLMVFFLGSIALGLKMVDSFLAFGAKEQVSEKNLRLLVRADWAATKSIYRNTFVFFSGLLVIILLFSRVFLTLMISFITKGYNSEPSSFLGALFSRFANNLGVVPLEDYIHKGTLLYNQGWNSSIVILLILLALLSYRLFRNSLIAICQRFPLRLSASLPKWLYLFTAAVMLGLAVSTRVSGTLAGALIAGFFLVKVRKKSIPTLIAYALISILVAYISWPYLWQNPIGSFIESLAESSNFEWDGSVLFQGVRYKSNALPTSYLPVLLTIQFTEPVFLLFGVGAILVITKIFKRTGNWDELLIVLAWFFAPFLLVIIFKPLMYDNFRHWLFIIPPIFVVAGCALDEMYKRISPKIVRQIITLACLFPGLYWGVNLHPYQYIYYNSFTGGVEGASGQYELDFWVTSYREATLYLNEEAPPNSKVLVVGPSRIFMSYAREDLYQGLINFEEIDNTTESVYVIIMTRYNQDLISFPEANVVHTVKRDGADLTVVKQIK